MATTYENSFTFHKEHRSTPGFIGRMFDRVIEARQKEANRRVATYLRSLDADTLRQYGYSDGQIKSLLGR